MPSLASEIRALRAQGLLIAGILLCLIGIVSVLSSFGVASFFTSAPSTHTHEFPKLAGFRRDLLHNCGEVFFCVNTTDPNPSSLEWQSPPFTPVLNNYQFASDVFDLSNAETVVVRESGVYLFTSYLALLSNTHAEATIALTANNDPILSSPVVDADLRLLDPLQLFGNLSVATMKFSAIARLDAGTTLRVSYIVTTDAFFAPGGSWAGVRLIEE